MRKKKMLKTKDLSRSKTEHYVLDFKHAIRFGDIKMQHEDDDVVITREQQDGTVNKVIVKDPHLHVAHRTNTGE